MDKAHSPHKKNSGSFRDPSGFVFVSDGVLYRQVNKSYAPQYESLMSSGLYAELTKRGYLITHEEVSGMATGEAHKVIRPTRVPFISYPYEWSFSELKDAAILTLKIQKIALKFGMWLKDASAYNIQFKDGKPVLIDTLSFDKYSEGMPWVAYRQFCQHFLAPLALMSLKEIRFSQLLRIHIDGIPLDLASKLLPLRSWFRSAVFFHIHMHAKSQVRYAEAKVSVKRASFGRDALIGLLESLSDGINALTWGPKGTMWADYYSNTNYSSDATEEKMKLVARFIAEERPMSLWDLGANEGNYSRLAIARGVETVSFDIDEASVERNYRIMKERKEKYLLPLVLDLTNPSPALGWANGERASLASRGPADMVLALALIHHLSITNHVPFESVAEYFASLGKSLVIEFVPKGDSQVERLLKNRADVFTHYTEEEFKRAFGLYFEITEAVPISSSMRTLYYMKAK